jgi:hypothetical protein
MAIALEFRFIKHMFYSTAISHIMSRIAPYILLKQGALRRCFGNFFRRNLECPLKKEEPACVVHPTGRFLLS